MCAYVHARVRLCVLARLRVRSGLYMQRSLVDAWHEKRQTSIMANA